MSVQQTILKKITSHIQHVDYLAVEDTTYQHLDHLPEGTNETHFNLTVVSDIFVDMTAVKRHRYIYKILNFELTHDIHALSLSLYTIQEYQDEKGYSNHDSWSTH